MNEKTNDINGAQKLERFKKAVFDNVNRQAKAITDEAESRREDILAQAQVEAQSLAESKKAQADKSEEARAVREISSRKLESKRKVLCYRENVIDRVFDGVKTRLADFVKSGDYEQYLVKSAELCRERYPESKGIIYLAPRDMAYAKKLENANAGLFEVRERDTIELGGLLAVYEDMGIALDRTFDSAFEEQRGDFTKKTILRAGSESHSNLGSNN
ncbi:V-type ATP synthase subunit E [Ruminococcus sp.]|uniref:V-type ATP synthase subunit E n=1 Tax=Ruminococcus sp. TaxID=41978 RepID=UPI0025E88944|nr:V-type ATP synthase subunit E [Ruminococcus sp.]